MPRGKLENLQDCEDFVRGCLFMATGGGGGILWGLSMLSDALKDGLSLEWVDADDIPDDVWTVTPHAVGTIAPADEETLKEIQQAELVDRFGNRSMEKAVQELSNHLGRPIGCIVPGELGAGNTPAPLVTGARLGIPVVDGDYAGRSVPEEMQGLPYLHGKQSWPFASVDRWGNVAIVTHCASPQMQERIGKMLGMAAYGYTTVAATPLPGREMKEILLRGSLSKCLRIGVTMRRAREKGLDPIDAGLEVVGGWRLFEGVVTSKAWENRDGYMVGTTRIQGSGSYQGQTLDVWFKNENLVSWLNGKPWVCSPDLVTLAYKDSGDGTTNTHLANGDHVVAVGMKGSEAFRTEFGLNRAAGPRHFGFDIEYVPIENLIGNTD